MEYRNGPRVRGSHPPNRMPRHQIPLQQPLQHQIGPQPRGPQPGPVMSAWQGNPINTYQNQDENMAQYAQPPVPIEYPQFLPYNQTAEMAPAFTGYPQYCPVYVDPMYHPGTQAMPAPGPPTRLRCPKCQTPNSLADAELAKKDQEISTLHQQVNDLLAEMEELKTKLTEQTSVPEVGVSSASPEEEEENGNLSTKMSQLSPDAIEFNPSKATDDSDVPVVSAKGINDDSSSEAPVDLGEESQVEEPVKSEAHSEDASPSPVPPPVDAPLVSDSGWDETLELTVSETVAVGQQEPEENNLKGADPNWADDEMSVKGASASAPSRHSPDNQFRPNYDRYRNNNRFPKRDDRKRDDYNNYGRGKFNNRRGEPDHYNRSYNNRGSNDKGRYGNRNQFPENNDRHYRDQDQSSQNGPQLDTDREDSCRGSTESLRDKDRDFRPQIRGGRRGNYHYRDSHIRDREWSQDQSKGDGPPFRSRGGMRGRPHEEGFSRHENRPARYNQSNGGTWRSPPPHPAPEVKNIVQEIQDDLFSAPPDFSLGHCVAKDFRMSSGIAVKFKVQFKKVPELLAQEVDVGGCAYLKDPDHDRYVFYLVTKAVSRGKPNYNTFKQSLEALKERCKELNVTKLAIPHIGCGLDQLDWPRVKGLINETFQDLEIQISAYEFNPEGVPESECNNKHLNPLRATLMYQHMQLSAIEPMTALVFFGTEDGHMDSTATSLDKKFNFVLEYKKAQKSVGKLWCYDKPSEYHIYSLIVAKTSKDKVTFLTLDSCVREMVKRLRKDKWQYLGVEAFVDWSDDKTFTERVVTLLQNMLPNLVSQLWVCFREPAHDFWNMAKPPGPQSAK